MDRPPPLVSVHAALPRPIACVRARVALARIPAVFAEHLNQVYAAGREGKVQLDGQNIFVYRPTEQDDVVDAEFGVGVKAPFSSFASIICTDLPSGEVATATHWGDYARLREAHHAVIRWCASNNRERSGVRWEVYGHWTEDVSKLRTDVFHLLK